MPTYALTANAKQQFFTSAGVLAAGYLLYTYEANSSTPATTYTSQSGGSNTNPIVLDARGEANIWLDPTLFYKFVLKTAADATVWTVDYVSAASGEASSTAVNLTVSNNLTVDGDTVLGDTIEGGTTTVNLGSGDSFTVQNLAGNTIFQINEDGTAEYPDGQILIEDLSEEVINLILSSGGGGTSSGGGSVSSGDGRLSLASGVKVMTDNYTAKTTVFYVGGLLLFFNDGSGVFNPFTIGELSQALSDTTYSPAASSASQTIDIFGWKDTLSISAMTRSGTTVSATTSVNHGLSPGAIVYISGANQSGYNGYHTLTVASGDDFEFEVTTTPATPATGTITAATGRISRGPAWKNGGQNLTGATNATPIVITATSHGLATGDSVEINNVSGNTAANGIWTITYVDANSFSLQTSVGNGSYTAGTGSFAARGVGTGTSEIELIGSTYVNSNDITNGPDANMGTYLGTIRTNSSNQLNWILGGVSAGGTEAILSVWNVSNRVAVPCDVRDSTTSWSYNSTTARARNASNTNRITFVRGLNVDACNFTNVAAMEVNNTAGYSLIGLNSTSVQAAGSTAAGASLAIAGALGQGYVGFYYAYIGLGAGYVQALELKAGGNPNNPTWFGNSTGFTAVDIYPTALLGTLMM